MNMTLEPFYKNSSKDDLVQLIKILHEALERIARCEDSPSIDPMGDEQFGLHCGVEDRDCYDRYDCADFGYTRGMERGLEWAVGEVEHALNSYKIKLNDL